MNALRDYLDAALGDASGQLHIAVGRHPYLTTDGKYKHKHWTPSQFEWPAEADQAERELLVAAADSDVYVCPYLMHGDKRAKGAAVARPIAHADVDHGRLDDQKVRAIDGFAVASGTAGNGHVYVQLTESVPAHWHTALCRALGAYLGGADAKISSNDVLRPPGTLNHKPTVRGGGPAEVQWLVPPSGVRVDPHTLAHQLGVTLPAQADPPLAGASRTVEPVDLNAYTTVKATVEHRTGDRSADTMRVVGACCDAGLTLAQARYVVNARADLMARLAERNDDDVLTCWLKAVDSRQERGRNTQWTNNVGGPDMDKIATGEQPSADDGIEGMPRLWNARDLRPAEQPRWLAKGRLPRGAISLVVGDEGIGKSLLWVWIAAAVTTGKPLPEFGIPAREPAHVILVCTEDDWTTTVRPRLEVAGADLTMVQVICTEDDGSGAPTFPRDLFLIAEADPSPALVVVDAWLDTVPAMLSVRDPQQARRALHPWKELATTTDAAVLLLCHTNRVASANARDRYGATGELRKKARMTLYAQADDEGRLVVGPEKMNTAAPIPASTFAISSVQHFPPTPDSDGTVPLLVYAGDSERTAREHIADAYEADHGTDPQDHADAQRWLHDYLSQEGPRAKSANAKREAARAGITEKVLRHARAKLGVVIGYEGMPATSVWSLPKQVTDDADAESASCAPAPVSHTTRAQQEKTKPSDQVSADVPSCALGHNKGTTARPAETGQNPPVVPVVPETHPPRAQQPPGAPTDNTPGMTPRVQQIIAKNRPPPPLCPVCERAPARTDSGMCDFCTGKHNRQQPDGKELA